jgi:hypothetical protein
MGSNPSTTAFNSNQTNSAEDEGVTLFSLVNSPFLGKRVTTCKLSTVVVFRNALKLKGVGLVQNLYEYLSKLLKSNARYLVNGIFLPLPTQ